MPQVLFRSNTLLVRAFLGRGSGFCVVTFDPMAIDCSLDREAFGEQFFASRDIDAVHILSAHNHWYQDADLPAALAAVRDVARRYPHLATYGSSMGGYAALRFSNWVGADVAVAISPQYSVQPPFADFDPRWGRLRRGTTWLFEQPGDTLPPVEAAVVFYDNRGLDRAHAEAVGRDLPHVALVKLPYAGHPAGAMLAETGVLSSAVLAALHGRVDTVAVSALRKGRHRSGHYFLTLARRQPTWRLRLKAALAARAVAASPHGMVYLSYAGVVASCRGDLPESLRLHGEAQPGPDYPDGAARFAAALLRAGDWDRACRTAARALRGPPTPGTPATVRLLAHLGPNASDVPLAGLLALRSDQSLPDRWPFLLAALLACAHRHGVPGCEALSLRVLRNLAHRRWFRLQELRSADGEERRQPVRRARAPKPSAARGLRLGPRCGPRH